MTIHNRIAYIVYKLPPALTGAGIRILRYCRDVNHNEEIPFILTKSGQSKKFFQYKDKTNEFNITKTQLKNIVVPKIISNKGIIIKLLSYFWSFIFIFSQLLPILYRKRKQYELIHSIGSNFITYNSILINKLLNKKIIIEVTLLNEPPVNFHNTSMSKKLINKFEQYIYKKADKYIVLSKALYNQLVKLGIDKKSIQIIENPVDIKLFNIPTDSEKVHLKNKWQIQQYSPVFIFIGALIQRKGVDLFPELFKKIVKKYPKSLFIILGEHDITQEERQYKDKIVNCLDNQEQIKFYGMVDDVNDYLKMADYFLFPSRNEGLPNAVLEAMASGLPVLMNKIHGITDFIIEHKQNGFIIENNEVDMYLYFINQLESDKKYYEKIKTNAKSTITEKFTIEKRNKKLINLYKELL
jgi:glycosyltransferase involved in cell wall biosynthesis